MKPFQTHHLGAEKSSASTWQRFWNWLKGDSPDRKSRILRIIAICGGTFLLLFALFFLWLIKDIPSISDLKNAGFAESSVIYDSTGETVLYSIHGEENRKYVPLADISPNMGSALLAAEDANFYTHPGVDFAGMLRSVYYLFRTGEIRGGGSTLTQQFARNSVLTKEQTVFRKLREIYLAFRLEHSFSKDEILELYLNKISFGNNAYGVEQAAQTYFAKSAKDLSIAESIVLASLPQAPTRWSPYGPHKESALTVTPEFLAEHDVHTESDFRELESQSPNIVNSGLLGKTVEIAPGVNVYLEGRTDYVLNQMKEKKFISDLEYNKTKEELQHLVFTTYHENIKAPHFVFYVKQLLEDQLGKEVVEQGGLRVYTTLDAKAQEQAELLATKQAEANKGYGVSNLALVAAEPSTGYIRAYIGSRNYWDEDIDGKVDILQQRRQPGSSFKPITYSAAFLNGLSPASVLFDVETKFGTTPIQNFSGNFSGPVAIRYALGNSLNVPAVKAGILAGEGAVYNLAKKMGFSLTRDVDFYGATIAIGSAEVEPMEMLQAYSILAMNGKKIPVTPILWVEDKKGNVLLDNRKPLENPEEVLDPATAYLVTDVLSDPGARGPGWNTQLQLPGRKNAVKTGTSNAVDPQTKAKYPNDLWTIGYTPDLVTVVWAGNNRGFVKNHSADGYNNAAPLWKKFMQFYLQGKPAQDFVRPEGVKTIAVDRLSGKLPPPDYPSDLIVQEIFSSLDAPTETSDVLKVIPVDKASGKLAGPLTPPDAIDRKVIPNFHSERPNDPAWEGPVQKWMETKGAEFLAKYNLNLFSGPIPTETDDVHTSQDPDSKPQVSILSPVSFGIVTPPQLDVFPDVSAPNGLKYVEIYWDNELKTTIKAAPWHTTISIDGAAEGSTHTLKVRAVDQLYYADESEISVKIGADTVPPKITFLFPDANASLPAGSLYTLQTNAVDEQSSVSKVVFTMDGSILGTLQKAPFQMNWQSPATPGEHTLNIQATDSGGNMAEQSISFQTTAGETSVNSFGFLSPASGATTNSPVFVSVGIPQSAFANFSGLDIWSQQSGGTPKLLHSFGKKDLPDSGIFSTALEIMPGEFDLWAKLNQISGGNQISPRIKVTVQ